MTTTTLINLFFNFSDIDSACNLFDQMPERDTAAWNSMLSGFSRNALADKAVSLFHDMGASGTEPNLPTLSILLRVCGEFDDQRLGRSVHGYSVRCFELGDASLDNSLLLFYNRLGKFSASEKLFERMPRRDSVSWNVMMSGYVKNGSPWRALEGFRLLRDRGLSLDLVTFDILLQACGQVGKGTISDGELIHGLLVKLGFRMDVYTDNSLLLMYCKCGRVELGKLLFDLMKVKNLVSWSVIVNGYVQIKHPEKAMALFRCALIAESEVSSELLVSALQAIKIDGKCIQHLMSIHCLVIKTGFGSNSFVVSCLISSYGDYREVKSARRCLDSTLFHGSDQLACWNAALSACIHHGHFSDVLELLHDMKSEACTFDAITTVNILSFCTHQLDLEAGKVVHGHILRRKLENDVFVASSLLELYIKCGLLHVACYLFSKMIVKNLVSWNIMIHGCVQNRFPRTSLRFFYLMQQNGFLPDATSLAGAIEAIAQTGYEEEKNYIHNYAIQRGFVDNEFVVNSLISMHAKFHDFDKASMLFEKSSKLSSVTWNAMIAEYSFHGLVDRAVSVFYLMKCNNVPQDSITLLSMLNGFSTLSSLNCIKWLHAIIFKSGYASDIFLVTSLINTYSKCGELSMARQAFEEMNSKTVVSWNSMIQGYGIHGNLEEAGRLFSQMQQSGPAPSIITFLILISACSHAGDVEKGQQYFDLMTGVYSFSPGNEHYSSYVDLLGRCGLVKEAYECLESMPSDPGVMAWGSLLGACRLQGNLDVGLVTAQKLFELDPSHPGYYTLMSNMFSEAGRWMDASSMKMKLGHCGKKKVRGWSRSESTL